MAFLLDTNVLSELRKKRKNEPKIQGLARLGGQRTSRLGWFLVWKAGSGDIHSDLMTTCTSIQSGQE
jgi:hypothetical protein